MENTQTQTQDERIENLNRFAEFLDNRFRIPGTDIRFGIDGLIGLIPYAGDVFTFIVSGYLLILMVRKGAGGKILFKMVWNIWFDGMTGTIPILGDIFDFRYRANIKNINLMQEFIKEDKHRGSAWPIILFLIGIVIAMIWLSIWAMRSFFYWVIS